MADIIHFTPRAELDADENLRSFIDVCRNQLTAFGASLVFDEPVWEITEALDLKAKNNATRLVFSTWSTVNDQTPSSMPEPYMSFAKAYMRYQQAMRPTKSVGSRIAALRAMEAVLSENGGDCRPSSITGATLNRAAQMIQERFTDAVAYRVGGQLQMLAEFLAKKHLMATPVAWRSSIRRPHDTARVGKEFDKQRQDKLPSPTALDALARIFHAATEPVDVFVSSIAAILCSAPDRINEVLHLEVNCEVTQAVPSSEQPAYGLRWRPSKGADPMIKWLVASMGSVVNQALSNIRALTEEARIVAKWYEDSRQQLYLPRHLEHLRRRERLSLKEIGEVLFTSSPEPGAGSSWCRQYKVPTVKEKNSDRTAAFADVEKAVLAMLPRGFPIANAERGLKYSDALCLLQRNALEPIKATYRPVIYLPGQGDIASQLGARSEFGFKSMFDRFGLVEEDGSHIHIRSHQFRHYLNTLAQAGGLSQLDIAKWSGRVDLGQNKVYDHQSDRDVIAQMREVTGDQSNAFSPLATARKTTLIPRDQFGRLKLATAHTTEYGYCIHDYSMLPCQIHRDCLNCTEQVCVKGEATKEANLRCVIDETRALLAEAETAEAEGDAGANRWVAHQKLTLFRAEQLCEILDDPNIPDGTPVQLSGIVPASRLEQTSERRRISQTKALASVDKPLARRLVPQSGG